MQIPFDIEINSGGVNDFEGLKELLDLQDEIQNKLAEQFKIDLGTNASQKLHSTKDQYLEAISVKDNIVTLDTDQFVVGMVEDGIPSFSMKEGLLNSPKAKIAKNGQKYLVVPLSTFKQGKYNWRNQQTGQFTKGTSGIKGIEFRIVSETSPVDSWVFPGYQGQHFVDITMSNFDNSQFDKIIDNELDRIFKN